MQGIMGIYFSRSQKDIPLQNRTADGLPRKSASLHSKKNPTRDPLMPADVPWAKHIRNKITDIADIDVDDSAHAEDF